MKELLKLHWQFVTNPSFCLKTYVREWPIKLGLFVFAFQLIYTIVGNSRGISLLRDVSAYFFGINNMLFVYFLLFINLIYIVLSQYYIMPFLVGWVARVPQNNFNHNLYRKIIFYSPSSYVIYSIIFLLPLKIVYSLFFVSGNLGMFSIVLIIIYGLLSIWPAVLIVNMVVVQWKGLKVFFNMNGGQIFLSIFVAPFVFALPFLAIYGPQYWDFLHKYIS